MFPFGLFGYAYYIVPVLQIICVLHVLRTNRSRDWIWLLIFLPLVGCIIYFIKEIYPSLRHSSLNTENVKTLFPSGRIKKLEQNLKIADTAANRLLLADEYARQNNFEKALELTSLSLNGLNADNPDMMLKMGRYAFGAGKFVESLEWLQKAYKGKNNRFDRPEDELLMAKALHQSGDIEGAAQSFQQIIRIHHSIEGRYFYGLLLKEKGDKDAARTQFQAIIEEKDLNPKHVRKANSQWFGLAKKELSNL